MDQYLTPADLLAVAAGGWGYAEASWIDGWHVRASAGFTHRANSAWPLAVERQLSTDGLRHTLRAVHDWYAERDLPALVQCVAGSDLDLAIAACGHLQVEHPALRQIASLNTIADAIKITTLTRPAKTSAMSTQSDRNNCVILADRPSPAWLTIYRSGGLPAGAEQVLGAGQPDVRFATIFAGPADTDHGTTSEIATGDTCALAIGRVALAVPPGVAGPARWAGLAAVETAPAARRRGLAKAAIMELLAWAAERGATDVFLEVTASNQPAIALYRSLGFTTQHAYHYRVIESSIA